MGIRLAISITVPRIKIHRQADVKDTGRDSKIDRGRHWDRCTRDLRQDRLILMDASELDDRQMKRRRPLGIIGELNRVDRGDTRHAF